MRALRDLIVIGLIISCSNFSCTTKESFTKAGFNKDSLASDILKADLAAMYDTEIEVHVPDYLLLGDTVLIKDELIVDKNKESNGSAEFLTLDSNHFIIVKEYDRSYCTFTIYNKKKESFGLCYLPTQEAIKLVHQEVDDLKIYFYDTYKRILKKYRRKVCEKYKVSEDELDSLSFLVQPEIDRIRSEFDINLHP